MPYPKKLPDSGTLIQLKRKHTYQEIAGMYDVDPNSVYVALRDVAGTPVQRQPKHTDLIPWHMDDPRHAFAPAAKNLRALGRRRAGRPLADAVAHRLDEWLQMLDRRNPVVAYDPEMPPNEASPTYGGWHYVPREPRDGDDVIRRPDPPTK